MKLLKNKTIYTGKGTISCGYIRYDRQIAEIGSMNRFSPSADDEEICTDATIVIPGFIDVHSHGGYSFDNMDASAEEIDLMVRNMTAREGVTSYFCTTMTQSTEAIDKSMMQIRKAAAKNPVIQGIHLEGPFVSSKYKGAQNEAFIAAPDAALIEHWNELSGGLVKLVTYAPEEASPEFEDWCLSHGIIPSAGHSQATYSQLKKSRACHITHLYNAQRGLNHRDPGVTGYGLLTDGVMAELICDGIHICPEMIALAWKVKGSDGIELITDSIRAKGMPEGISELGGQTVYVKDGTARLADGTIAGSVLTYINAFRNIISFTGASIEDAVKMTSGNQAREFGLTQKGFLQTGKDADFVLLDTDLNLKDVISMGSAVRV